MHDLVDASDAFGDIVQSEAVGRAMDRLRTFLFQTVYTRSIVQQDGEAIRRVIAELIAYFLANPRALPLPAAPEGDQLAHVVDHVAGMTDRYAQRVHQELCAAAG